MVLDLFSNFKWVRGVRSDLAGCSKKKMNLGYRMQMAFSGPNLVSRNGDGG